MKRNRLLLLLPIFFVLFSAPALAKPERTYPWRSSRFNLLVEESFRQNKAGEEKQFYTWISKAFESYPGRRQGASLDDFLAEQTRLLTGMKSPADKAKAHLKLAGNIHAWVKKSIPKFNLDRGFEFSNVVLLGERQCFLQSVLIAGLLQKAGADTGVVMVFRNFKGDTSNNGHAAVLLKLTDGRDAIVDASDPEPFIPHKGLFLDSGGYRFVSPVYEKNQPWIKRYMTEAGGAAIPLVKAFPLDYDFVRSQFWYYRGERVRGGVLASRPELKSLKTSAMHLRKSVSLCPHNPLAVYMLGRALLALGEKREALKQLESAMKLYGAAGWVPDGPKAFLEKALK